MPSRSIKSLLNNANLPYRNLNRHDLSSDRRDEQSFPSIAPTPLSSGSEIMSSSAGDISQMSHTFKESESTPADQLDYRRRDESFQQIIDQVKLGQVRPQNLWQTAYSSLDDNDQARLSPMLSASGGSIAGILEDVTRSAKEGSMKSSAGRKLTEKILLRVSSVQEIVAALAACDPTGHAAPVWSVVSIGLKISVNQNERKDSLLKISSSLSDILCRYAHFEIYSQAPNCQVNHEISNSIVRVYTAMLKFVVASVKIKEASTGRRVFDDLSGSSVSLLKDLKATIDQEDEGFTKWSHMEFLFRQKKDMYMILDGIYKIKTDQDARNEEENWRKFLDWIYKFPVHDRLNDLIGRRNEDIGRSFLNSKELNDWKTGSNQILHCYGLPSSGKTMLMAATVENLQIEHPQTPLAYVLSDFKSADQQTFTLLVSSILRQLLERCPVYQSSLRCQFEERPKKSPKLRHLLEELENLISFNEKTLILLDGLDELHLGVCQRLLDQLCHYCGIYSTLQLLTTSRPKTINFPESPSCVCLEIRPKADDIMEYIENSIQNPVFTQDADGPSLRKEAVNRLYRAARGIYLIPKIQISIINEIPTKRVMSARLKNLPTEKDDLDSTYKDAMKRIARDELAELHAHSLLAWLMQAKRPLRREELLIALSVGEFDGSQSNQDEKTLESITAGDLNETIAYCVGMVDYDEKGETVRLAHETTFEFLKENSSLLKIDAKSYVARTCLSYLAQRSSGKDSIDYDFTLESLIEEDSFLDYTARYLGSHMEDAGTSSPALQVQLKVFLEEKSSRVSDRFFIVLYQQTAIREALMLWKGKEVDAGFYEWSQQERSDLDLNNVQLLVLLGLPSVLDDYFKRFHYSPDFFKDGDLPLNYAAYTSGLEAAKVLFKHGANVNTPGKYGRAPLHSACRSGSIEMVELLLGMGADVGMTSSGDLEQTPLHVAAFHDRSDVVDLLLRNRAPINVGLKGFPRNTPLRIALDQDRGKCREFLLFKNKRFTPNNVAGLDIPMESSGLVRRLLEESYVSPHQIFGQGQGCLDIALLQRDRDLVEFCLEKETQPKLYWTIDSEEILVHKDEPFYDVLMQGINQSLPPVCTESRMMEAVWSWDDSKDRRQQPYLTITIPKGSSRITKVEFTITAHDQGWSSFSYDHGAFNSLTWFEAGLAKLSRNGSEQSLGLSCPIITQNKHAVTRWTTHKISWDRRETSPDIEKWFENLLPGRLIQVFPRVTSEIGWQNHVQSMRVDLFS